MTAPVDVMALVPLPFRASLGAVVSAGAVYAFTVAVLALDESDLLLRAASSLLQTPLTLHDCRSLHHRSGLEHLRADSTAVAHHHIIAVNELLVYLMHPCAGCKA